MNKKRILFLCLAAAIFLLAILLYLVLRTPAYSEAEISDGLCTKILAANYDIDGDIHIVSIQKVENCLIAGYITSAQTVINQMGYLVFERQPAGQKYTWKSDKNVMSDAAFNVRTSLLKTIGSEGPALYVVVISSNPDLQSIKVYEHQELQKSIDISENPSMMVFRRPKNGAYSFFDKENHLM